MITISRPSRTEIKQYLLDREKDVFSYAEVGASSGADSIPGYDNDLNQVCLGKGKETFTKACNAILNWKMFPGGWAWVEPVDAPIEKGLTVAMVVKIWGVYWVNSCRIVYLLDEKEPVRRFGFAYGTLPSHVEKGEELFSVEWRSDDSVWYVLRAYSKPRFWLARLGYPMARYYQRKFVKASLRAMQRAVRPHQKQDL